MPVKLNHRDSGTAGAPVVLLHPVGLDLTSWDEVVSVLAQSHRVIAADLRGHGQSPRTPRSTDIFDYAADVAALIEDLGLAPCTVVGVSFGGMISLALAISRPDLLRSAVVSACPNTIPEAARPLLAARGEAAEAEGMDAVLDESLERWFSPGFMGAPQVLRVRERLLADDPEDWNAGWQTISRLNLGPRLGEVAVPVHCIHAEEDKGASIDALRSTAEGVPVGTLEIIAGASHMVHIECAAEFAALLKAHLAEQAV
ncbi:alpha/beta fold hydrolase [Silicimonas algicola]|uniref:3-oxoadipate enol-lactonase n=1 Tax=Silicimonas algicola TaxID=1826607 RepID=A0A316FVT7_9RHOB|nr:alpha/beta hydrolase [Silicimonas algicola]AZQ68317.1 alpha/beta fold hydrolase [Silicimonas algicola]PWK52709.1 3-oxoadipate enol-lactonase [Silicimonas algicola]